MKAEEIQVGVIINHKNNKDNRFEIRGIIGNQIFLYEFKISKLDDYSLSLIREILLREYEVEDINIIPYNRLSE